MEALEVQFRIPGHPALEQATREALMDVEVFRPLPHTVIARLLAHVVPGTNWLTAQIQGAAVFVADDWVVSIHGEKLIDCVSAMCILINSVSRQLDSSISIDLLTPLGKGDNLLYRQLERESKKARTVAVIKWGLTILISALAGASLQWLFGGDILP